MTESARTINWAGGSHTFDLADKRAASRLQVIGLPGQYGNTATAAFQRFEQGVYSIDDVERIIEWGLIGGGMSSLDAKQIVDLHVRGKPIATNAMLAMNILTALFIGAEHADASA